MDALTWYNEPPTWDASGDQVRVMARGKTDFWRKTHYGFIRDDGHFGYLTVHGPFVAEVQVQGAYEALYDQAGLMVRLDEQHWIKCGIEYLDGVQQASAVVTRDYSDWSVVALPENPAALWLRLTRKDEMVEVQYSLDGNSYGLLRLAYLPPSDTVQVGVMCASPQGDGFQAIFTGFSVRPLAPNP